MMSALNEYLTHVEMLGETTTLSIITASFIVLIVYYFFSARGILPGPFGLPFFGYSQFLKDHTIHLVLDNHQKKYGDLFSFTFAGTLYINMASIRAVRELHLNKAECFERMSDFSFFSYVFADGVGFVNGEPWKVLRKFCLQQFRECGMTTIKDNMTGPMYDSIKETIDYIREKNGEPIEIVRLLTDKCNVILRRTLFGDTGITEQQVKDLNESYGQVMAFMTVTNMMYAGNISRYFLLPLKSGYWAAMKQHKQMEKVLHEVVADHKAKFKNEHPRNFIDCYLKERNERYSKGDPTAEFFTDRALVSTLVQFVGDGVLSVATFIAVFLKAVVDHPECQDKIYSEILEIVGHTRLPAIEDKSRMPFTHSFIMEMIRTSDFFTAFPSLQCCKETTVRGYRIPKGAVTLVNVWACHHDPTIYEEPEKFDPARFVTQDGKQRPELPNMFGVGRRNCIGEGYVMAQIFLFLTTIVQNFKLAIPKDYDITTFNLFLSGKVEICATPRNLA